MKIIDAHLHFAKKPYFDEIAVRAGHENTEAHLRLQYEHYQLVHGIVMGGPDNVEEGFSQYPEFLSYCAGIKSSHLLGADAAGYIDKVEQHLKNENCVGVKLYPGYEHFELADHKCSPVYELAQAYHKPVAIHTGAMASQSELSEYSHPFALKKAAQEYRHVNFVMCHFGEPWFQEAFEVMQKHENITADLSGILEGKVAVMDEFIKSDAEYIGQLKQSIRMLDQYERFLFGTDWPLANIGDYIEFTRYLIPEKYQEMVFYHNAKRVYKLFKL